MGKLIDASIMRIDLNPIMDVFVDDQNYASDLLQDICKKLKDKSDEIHLQVEGLKDPRVIKQIEVNRKNAKYTKILFGVIGFTMMGIALYKSKDKLLSL